MTQLVAGNPPATGTPEVITPPTGFEPLDPAEDTSSSSPSTATGSATTTAQPAEAVSQPTPAAPVVVGVSVPVGPDTVLSPGAAGSRVPSVRAVAGRIKVKEVAHKAASKTASAVRAAAGRLERMSTATLLTVAGIAVLALAAATIYALAAVAATSREAAAYRDAFRQERKAAEDAKAWAASATEWQKRIEAQRDAEARKPWYQKLGK